MIYLGSLSRMVGVACPSEQRVASADRFSFQTTLEGRVKAQFRPGGRRAWDLRLPRTSSPLEVSKLTDFTSGVWGPGPFRFVSAEAATTNLLPPEVARMDIGESQSGLFSDGGPWAVLGDLLPKSWVSDGSVAAFFGLASSGSGLVPVIPGRSVMGAVTVLGDDAYAHVQFFDDQGGSLGRVNSSVRASAGSAVRSWVAGIAPEGSAYCRLYASNAVRLARPQVTWTEGPVDWADGRGCVRAVVLGGQSELVRANQGPNNRTLEGVSFTVQEVD